MIATFSCIFLCFGFIPTFEAVKQETIHVSQFFPEIDQNRLTVHRSPAVNSKLASPIFAHFNPNKSRCVIVLSEQNWNNWGSITSEMDRTEFDDFVRFAVAHELAHCADNITQQSGIVGSSSPQDPSSNSVEHYADQRALDFMRVHHPRGFNKLLSNVKKLRSNKEFSSSEHSGFAHLLH